MKTISAKRAKQLTCLALLDLAKHDDVAFDEIRQRAANWELCAVGDAAKKNKCSPYDLTSADEKLEEWGIQFVHEVSAGRFGSAKTLYHKIAARTKRLFGTKEKRNAAGIY
jgi:hypothetical protein